MEKDAVPMIQVNNFASAPGDECGQGSILTTEHFSGWHLRFDTSLLSTDGTSQSWLVDLNEERLGTVFSAKELSNEAVTLLKNSVIEVEPGDRKVIWSVRGMEGWLVLIGEQPAIIATNPYGRTAANIIVGFDGNTYQIESGTSAVAFANWRIALKQKEREYVVCEFKAPKQ